MSPEPPMSLVNPDIIREMVALASTTPDGSFVEVGVYKGGTAWHLTKKAIEQNRRIYLYDTFTGIPYKGEFDSHKVGDFGDTSILEVANLLPEAIITQGIFPTSAVDMGRVAFVHLDCDQYQAVSESIYYLIPLMVTGGIMWFDDYGCLDGATRAVEGVFGKDLKFSEHGHKAYAIL